MKVYIALGIDYDNTEIFGVYATKEEANERNKEIAETAYHFSYEVVEAEVGKGIDQ